MGERIINPLFNVQDKYKEKMIINPYRFGSGTGLKTGLVSVWELDETSGTTAFDSHGSNDGTNNGASVNQAGKIDKAYDFDGVNDDISFGSNSSLDFTSSFSVSAWIYLTSYPSTAAYIIGKGVDASSNSWFLRIPGASASGLSFGFRDNNGVLYKTQIPSVLSLNTWHHVAATYGDNIIVLYLDGSVIETVPDCVNKNISTGNVYIGKHDSTSAYYFDGKIDQTAVWNRALTATEVSTLYNSGNGLAYSGW